MSSESNGASQLRSQQQAIEAWVVFELPTSDLDSTLASSLVKSPPEANLKPCFWTWISASYCDGARVPMHAPATQKGACPDHISIASCMKQSRLEGPGKA